MHDKNNNKMKKKNDDSEAGVTSGFHFEFHFHEQSHAVHHRIGLNVFCWCVTVLW